MKLVRTHAKSARDSRAWARGEPACPGLGQILPIHGRPLRVPCPSSGIIIQGEADEVVTPGAVQKLVDKLRTQKHITIHHDVIPHANHFFAEEIPQLMKSVDDYLDMRLGQDFSGR